MKAQQFFQKTARLAIIGIALSTMGLSCTLFQSGEASKEASRPIALEFWGVFDEGASFDTLIAAYRKEHPNITISYRKFRYEEYEKEIVEALAEDRGPDIIAIPNTWVDRYATKLLPMPQSMNIGFLITKGAVKKVTEASMRQVAGYTPRFIEEAFVPTVAEDVVRPIDGSPRILALPFSVDTLALFYNQTLLRNTGVILAPPKYWAISDDDPSATQKRVLFQDFVSQAQKLTILDPNTTEVIQAGAAFGGSKNVDRTADILATLMMQNGSQMAGDGTVNFDYDPNEPRALALNPGVDALRFYTDFSSPVKQVYSWSDEGQGSFEAFAQGKTALFFGYSYHASQLATAAPQLRYGIVPVPQINPNRPAVMANYWVNGVSKKSKNPDYAWDFLRFSTQPDVLKNYLKATMRPTPLKGLIEEQKQDLKLEPFVSQLLFARNWYHGKNSLSMEAAFSEMIQGALLKKGANIDEERAELSRLMDTAKQIIQNGW